MNVIKTLKYMTMDIEPGCEGTVNLAGENETNSTSTFFSPPHTLNQMANLKKLTIAIPCTNYHLSI